MSDKEWTYQQLDDVLTQLGFSRSLIQAKWLCYDHDESGTEIILIEKKPNDLVRETDAWSARQHLILKGLISEEELEHMLANGVKKRAPVRSK